MGLRDGVGVILKSLIQGDDVQHVQKLPLILVEPLHLNVEDGVRVQFHAPGLLGMGGEGRLVGPLDGTQPLQNRGVIGIVIQLFQGLGVQQIVVPAGQVRIRPSSPGLISLSQRRWSMPLVTFRNFQAPCRRRP